MLNGCRVAIVLAEFQDVKMAPGTKEYMQDLWFSSGRKIPTGSVTEYYDEVSNGKISFTGEVVGPFTLSRDLAYYANDREFHHDSGMRSYGEVCADLNHRVWKGLAGTECADDGG
jgi:M6 family metalloprotease-like protein